MIRPTLASALPLLFLAKQALAFGCETHSYTTCEDGIVHWFDPDDGQICDPLDCGGGRAPPKKNPGCDGYTGTETRGISYLSCWKPSTAAEANTAATTTEAEATVTEAETDTPTETESEATEADAETGSEPTETESGSSTTAADVTSTQESDALTTSAATLSTKVQTTGNQTRAQSSEDADETETQATEEATAAPSNTVNAGQFLRGSLMAVAGAAVGVMALI